MTTNNNNAKKSFTHGVELVTDAVIKGLQTSLQAGMTSLTVRGATVQVADLVKTFQGLVQPWKD